MFLGKGRLKTTYQALRRFAHPRRTSTKCRPKMRPKTDSDATQNVSWTDDEAEQFLGMVRSYSSQKDYEGLRRP